MKILTSNKKAYFNFDILDKLEAGIILEGWEVKSIKQGRMSLDSSYIKEEKGGFFLINSKVPKYKFSDASVNMVEDRQRKLLLNKREIISLNSQSKQEGATIVPLEIIQNDKGLIKVIVALVKGRKKFDKRNVLKEKDMKRRIDTERKKYNV
jgi:SsrA-binding protein